MDIALAITHIGGSLVALLILGFLVMLAATWISERTQKRALEEASIQLGVPVEELNSEQHAQTIVKWSAERFSSELFKNRFSDFLGIIRKLWEWVGLAVQVIVLLTVIWYTVTDSLEAAVYAWLVVGVAFFFWIVSVVFTFVCKLLTGRFPGEASQARKTLAQFLSHRRGAIV